MTTSSASGGGRRIDELRLRPIVTIAAGSRLDEVAHLMRTLNVSTLVVGDPDGPLAIVTEHDLTQALADGRSASDTVDAIASTDPVTVASDASVMEVATLMLRECLGHLIVTRRHRVIGMVSIRSVIAALVTTMTTDTVLVRLERHTIDPPAVSLG
jgi:signal-transduction protein with cAMP-binding, CBS, and nucleotidyltransferase domain